MSALARPVQLLRRTSPGIDRAVTRLYTARVMTDNPIVIFSMGKTGTTSITGALGSATGRPVVKAHALSSSGIERRMAKAARLRIKARPRFLWACEQIAQSITAGGPWQLICGVRDPVALAVSDHFYGLSEQHKVGRTAWMAGAPADHAKAIVENLSENFINRDWFDDELKPITGIDVYDTPFPNGQGSTTRSNDRYSALILRAEDLSTAGPDAIANHLDLTEPLPIDRHNKTVDSSASPYAQFLAEGELPVEILDAVYATQMSRHFYTEEELDGFRARWAGLSR